MPTAVPRLTLIVTAKGEDGCGGVFVGVALSSPTSLASSLWKWSYFLSATQFLKVKLPFTEINWLFWCLLQTLHVNDNNVPSGWWELQHCQPDASIQVATTWVGLFKGLNQSCGGGSIAWKWKPERNPSHSLMSALSSHCDFQVGGKPRLPNIPLLNSRSLKLSCNLPVDCAL